MINAMKKLLYIVIMVVIYTVTTMGCAKIAGWIMDKLDLEW